MNKSHLQKIKKKNILVVGDVMLDMYFNGEVKRISPEAPVPIFLKTSEYSVLGGAGNVAANLIAANQNVSIISIVGKDSNGIILLNKLKNLGINTEMISVLERDTTVKTRFLATNNQQVLRFDVENTAYINDNECSNILNKLKKQINNFDIILLSDYNKGLLTYNFTQSIIQMAKQNQIRVIIDVKDSNIAKYNNAFLLKPNLNELQMLTKLPVCTKEEIIYASNQLLQKCNCKYVLTTCGAQGMILVEKENFYSISAINHEVFDVTGAGDTTIAYLATCMANNFPVKKALEIANYAAGIQVRKVGTSIVYQKEIEEYLSNHSKSTSHKIIENNMIDKFRIEHINEKIIFTNGCFDILHVGHIRYLQESAKLGDKLVVGINSDKSVKKIKGNKRPINTEQERAELLAALKFVDYIVIFDEETPYELIKKIQPDILVKGGDYNRNNVIGADLVEQRGGKLIIMPYTPEKSTTKIIEKLNQ